MPTPQELEADFWKALKSDMTMMLGLDGVEDGHARPMTAQVEGDHGPIWFFTSMRTGSCESSARARAIATFAAKGHDLFATVHGAPQRRQQPLEPIDRLWNRYVAAWYEGGKDDPKLAVAGLILRRRNLARRVEPGRRHQDAARRRSEAGLQGQGGEGVVELAYISSPKSTAGCVAATVT